MFMKLLIAYIVYFIIGSSLIFIFPKDVSMEYREESSQRSFYSNTKEEACDRAIILDTPLESGLARLYTIENAQESLDIAYYAFKAGETPNIFLGTLLDAADRGVKVNMLLDGMSHGLRGSRRSIIYAMANHPNIHLRFYEKVNPLLPWTINNRMHDKYIIADGEIGLIGGRNIGDMYFAPEWYEKAVTNDRDVMIIKTKKDEGVESGINQMASYFNQIWNHKYSKDIHPLTKRIFKKPAISKADELREKAGLARETYKDKFDKAPDLHDLSLPTRKVSFIHNPIKRFSKEPWCWYELVELSKGAKESVFVQSPYIIPSRKMLKNHITEKDLQGKDIIFFTNSLTSTPNLPAYAGYQNYRKKIVDQGIHVIEIQTTDSIHSKSFVIDKDIVAIGSFNLDPRSAFLSTESMVVIHSEELVESFGTNLLDYTDESLSVGKDYAYLPNDKVEEGKVGAPKKFLINFLSIFAKFFDYML